MKLKLGQSRDSDIIRLYQPEKKALSPVYLTERASLTVQRRIPVTSSASSARRPTMKHRSGHDSANWATWKYHHNLGVNILSKAIKENIYTNLNVLYDKPQTINRT